MSEQFLNGTSLQCWLYSVIQLEVRLLERKEISYSTELNCVMVNDRQLNSNQTMTVFKVWDATCQLKKLVVTATLSEIMDKGLSLGIFVLVFCYCYYPLCSAETTPTTNKNMGSPATKPAAETMRTNGCRQPVSHLDATDRRHRRHYGQLHILLQFSVVAIGVRPFRNKDYFLTYLHTVRKNAATLLLCTSISLTI